MVCIGKIPLSAKGITNEITYNHPIDICSVPKACNALPSAYCILLVFHVRSWKKIGNCSILLPMLLYPPPSLCILALVGRVWEKIQATTGLIFFSCPCSGIHEGDFILLNFMYKHHTSTCCNNTLK